MPERAVATLTRKGRLTIPKIIRDAMSLHEGDPVRFVLDHATGRVTMEPVRFRPEDLNSFAVPGSRRMSLAEMEAAKLAGFRGHRR